jgi:hypothetical protein
MFNIKIKIFKIVKISSFLAIQAEANKYKQMFLIKNIQLNNNSNFQ